MAAPAGPESGVTSTETVEEVLVTAPEPRYVAPTTRDRIGRIWVPVLIDGKGPFRLVLDTGASRPAITRRLVDELGLPVQANPVMLRGATGSAVVPAVKLGTLEIGELLMDHVTVPVVADAFGGADGVFGGQALEDMRIVIEFRNDRISIARSHKQSAPPGYSTVHFRYSGTRGMRADVMVGPVRATALIDTGAQVTVGNLALREALARRGGELGDYADAIVGVTEEVQQASRVRIPNIVAGQLIMSNASIMFSDLRIFEHWQLSSKPALMIGMDVIGVLDTLVIDYKRSELQIRTAQ